MAQVTDSWLAQGQSPVLKRKALCIRHECLADEIAWEECYFGPPKFEGIKLAMVVNCKCSTILELRFFVGDKYKFVSCELLCDGEAYSPYYWWCEAWTRKRELECLTN